MFVIKSEPYYRGCCGISCYDIKVYGSISDNKYHFYIIEDDDFCSDEEIKDD